MTLRIPARFNGPSDSGNGGYACGLVAAQLSGDAEVTLRQPPPLERDLEVAGTASGIGVFDGDTLIAEAVPVEWILEVPPPPSLDEAAAAAEAYRGRDGHTFPTCFSCGPARDDGLAIFPGPVPGRAVVASPWSLPGDIATHDGLVPDPVVWAALDCPGAWASGRDITVEPVVLGRMAARVVARVPADGRFVSYGWATGEEGRKSYAGTAVADAEGTVLAFARQTWIALR